MQKTLAWGVSAAVVGVLAAGFYVWQTSAPRQVAPLMPPAVAPGPAPTAPLEPAQPAIRYPIESVPRTAEPPTAKALPSLDASDAEFVETLGRLVGRSTFDALLKPEQVIRRIVVTVDNLPRKTYAQRMSPANPVPGVFLRAGAADPPTLASADVARYAPYVSALEAVDARKLVAVYAYFYPLFQQAYRELGYPNGYFNDRLIEAIDVALTTPEMRAPPALAQPRVLYQFADPDLEALPAAQKVMLRLGPDNAARVKAKLLEMRRALTARTPPAEGASAPSAPEPSSRKASGG